VSRSRSSFPGAALLSRQAHRLFYVFAMVLTPLGVFQVAALLRTEPQASVSGYLIIAVTCAWAGMATLSIGNRPSLIAIRAVSVVVCLLVIGWLWFRFDSSVEGATTAAGATTIVAIYWTGHLALASVLQMCQEPPTDRSRE